MITTITQYDRLAKDADGNALPVGVARIGSEARTSVGAFAALDASAAFIRVASDTAVKITDGTSGGNPMFVPANVPEYFGVSGGEVLTSATV